MVCDSFKRCQIYFHVKLHFLSGPLNFNDLLQASFVDIDTISLKNKQIICLTCIANQILQ